MSQKTTVHIDANVQARLLGLEDVVSKLQNGINKGLTQIDLSKGIGKELSGLISKFQSEASKLKKFDLTGGMLEIKDAKEFEKIGRSVIKTYQDIERISNSLGAKNNLDFKKIFSASVNPEIDKARQSLQQFGKDMEKIFDIEVKKSTINNDIKELTKDIEELDQAITSLGKKDNLEKTSQSKQEYASGKKSEIQKRIKQLEEEEQILEKAAALQEAGKKLEKGRLTYKGKSQTKWTELRKAGQVAEEEFEAVQKAFENRQEQERILRKAQAITFFQSGSKWTNSREVEGHLSALGLEENEMAKMKASIQEMNDALRESADLRKQITQLDKKTEQKNKKQSTVNNLRDQLNGLNETKKIAEQGAVSIASLVTQLNSLEGIKVDRTMLETKEGIEGVIKQLDELDEQKIEKVRQALNGILDFESNKGNFESIGKDLNALFDDIDIAKERAQDLQNLKRRMLDFFSISNSIEIFKRTVRESFETVKELDAVMTETAVVTDFTVGDMWDKLPTYAKQASSLGASIKDLYSATTLYYQQGLNSEQAMNVGVETMKMARIANMDAADATTAMTAALRGFNMEIDETSATRVNDVYSELAAITAADTNQIATAMTKTASIANSANMEFETTAAFLAQIIETTQEAPETAGTAMKTIIARFTEVKELFDEGMLTGEDSEGEAININKIDAALKTVGISLKDFLRGEKGIDDIFLELASKWDTLDLATQRYIATTAAGSRQQSRFIAMMSNYERTMQLVNAANNSAGASQNQYEKTLDSMEAKLQKLKNAWDVFVMNLANNDILKGGIDILTGILETVNNLTEAFSGGNGLTKSLLSFLTLLGALKGGNTLLKKGLGYIGGAMGLEQKASSQNQQVATKWNPFRFQQIDETSLGYGPLSMLGGFFEKAIPSESKINKLNVEAKELEAKSKKASVDIEDLESQRDSISNEINKASQQSDTEIELFGSEDISKKQNQIKEIEGEIQKKKQEKDDIDRQIDSIQQETKEISQGYQKANMVSGILTSAGLAASLLSNYAEEEDMDKLATGLEHFGTTAQFAGVGVNILNQALALSGKTWAQFGSAFLGALPILLGVAAVAGLGYMAYQASPEGQLKAAEKKSEQATEYAEDTKKSYEELTQSLKSIEEQSKAIDKMVSGTEEWNTAVKQLNKDTADLLENHEELVASGAVSYQGGILKLDETKVTEYQKEQEIKTIKAAGLEIEANKAVEQARLNTINQNDYLGYFTDTSVYTPDTSDDPGVQGMLWYDTLALEELAKAVASNEVIDDNTAQTWLEKNYKGGQVYIDEGDIPKLRDWGEALLASENKTKQYDMQMAQNIKTLAEANGGISDFSKNLDDSFIADMYEKQFNSKKSELDSKVLTQGDFDDYAKLKGYTYKRNNLLGNKAIFEDSQGETVRIKIEDIRKDLATDRAQTEVANNLNQIERQFTGDARDLASQLFSQDGIDMVQESVDKFSGLIDKSTGKIENTDDNRKKIAELLGQTEGWDKFAEAMNTTPEALFELVTSNVEMATKRMANQRKDLVVQMNKYTKMQQGSLSDFNAGILKGLEEDYGDNFRDTLQSIFEALGRSGDDSIIGAGYGNFITKALQGLEEADLYELADFIENIDWSSPIEAAYQLNREVNKGNGISKEFAENMTSVENGFLGAGSQLRYLVQQSEYETISEELNKILETSTEISASDVLNLADSYSSLNKMLQNTETSAAGVAKALQSIEEGDIELSQLTDAVLGALSGYDSLNSMIAELNKTLVTFDPGIDENFVSSFIGQANETIASNLEKGAVGNSQIDKYLDLLFTDSWDEGLSGAKRTSKIQQYSEFLANNSENMKDFWTNIASGKTALGQTRTGEQNAALEGLQISLGEDGEIVLSGYEGKTTEQQAKALAAAADVSETLAKMALTDYKNYSDDHDYNMATQESDNLEIATNALKGKNLQEGQGTYIDQSEIDAINKLTGASLTQEILQQAAKNAGYGAVEVTDFYDDQGQMKRGESFFEEMSRIQGFKNIEDYKETLRSDRIKEEYDKSPSDTVGNVQYKNYLHDMWENSVDLNEISKQLSEVGLPQEAKTQIAQDAADAFFSKEANKGKKFTVDFQASDGSLQTLELEAGDSVAAGIAEKNLEIEQTSLANSIQQAFASNPITVKVQPAVEGDGEITTSGVINLEPNVPELGPYSASLNLIPSIFGHAQGIKNSPDTHDAMVGEEGPELIERQDGTAYLSGVNGPEITRINTGDTVHTAEETKKIFKHNKGYSMPRFSGGVSHAYGDAKSSGKKTSSDSKKNKEWENPYDKLYNLLREINEELRERERIERRYEQLLESLDVSARKIIDISRKELAQLETNRALEEKRIKGRQNQIEKYQEENKDLNKYGWTETNERGETVLRIDWDLIDTVKDTEQGEKIEIYIGQLEEWFDDLETAQDSLEDIEDLIFEIKQRGEEEYKDLEETIKDAVVSVYEKEIERLEEINDSINDTNAELLDSIQKSIDKQRQDRDNQKTEEELAEKQRRLLYLQQDTSGANAVEIMRLQKEIEEGQEDYTDTLIDQKISDLQEQNEEAAKQRDQQITLLQSQLDHYIESGHVWDEVYDLMRDGLDESDGLVRGSRLEEILKSGEAFEGMSVIGQMEWWKDMNNMIAQGLAYLEVGRQLEDIGVKENTEIEFTDDTGKVIKGKVDKNGNVVDDTGYIYDNVFQGADGNFYAGKNIKSQEELKPKPPKKEEPKKETETESTSSSKSTSTPVYTADDGTKFYNWSQMQNYNKDMANAIDKYNGSDTDKMETLMNQAKERYAPYMVDTYKKKYKTGGLADFTGPAWLDGTKARPELVLNQRDTQNFIKLKDILSSIMSRNFSTNSATTENNGDITYDIDINVETIGSDYDVEQVANKVKSMITDSARYRNNNAIGLTR